VLGRYVRERKVLALEDAIRRMTGLPAASLGLPRGTIEAGAVADLVLLDAAMVGDRATLAEPHASSVGIKSVWVGGEVVYAEGKATGATPGRVLRRANRRRRPQRLRAVTPSTTMSMTSPASRPRRLASPSSAGLSA
jgi:N-acyl-D-amino-acid deacylase